MLWSQRQQHSVLGRSGLQLEIELTAESLSKSQRPGLVHAAAERRMHHQLHAPGLVEKAFDNERGLGRDGTKDTAALGEIDDGLLRGTELQSALLD